MHSPGHDVSVFLRVSAQLARCFGAADNQSARAALPPLIYGHLEFTVPMLKSTSRWIDEEKITKYKQFACLTPSKVKRSPAVEASMTQHAPPRRGTLAVWRTVRSDRYSRSLPKADRAAAEYTTSR
ncbi:hypothetical protein Y032_0039g1 [Ancylostoma ceylanicum]|uniref:Uncharacterized protein n=1 Tax=Ancylostoma ceylanicum TaxID=53326 RepID=A0A016UIG4_9BILA|nr:hypothetical protein Y032_0039g1 [Ancylostoma ceylanicum]